MKTSSFVPLLCTALAIGLAGCSENTAVPVSPIERPPSAAADVAPAGKQIVRSVTGNANIWIAGKMGVLTLSARLYDDGTADGRMNLVNVAFNPDQISRGPIVALKFYDHYTFSNGVSGPVALFWFRETVLQGYQGKYFACFVVDNGQGNNAPAQDWAGPTNGPHDSVIDIDPQYMVDSFPDFFVPIAVGNVVIH